MEKKLSLQAMMEAAIFAAFALILDLLPSIKLSPAISISFAMVPIFIVAFRWGVKAGAATGLIWGLLQLIFDPWVVSPVQAVMEYVFAFSFIGAAGIVAPAVRKAIQENARGKLFSLLAAGILLGSIARYVWHFFAGMIFFGQYAPKGQSAFMYSLIANGTSGLGSAILCTVVLSLLVAAATRVLYVKQLRNS